MGNFAGVIQPGKKKKKTARFKPRKSGSSNWKPVQVVFIQGW